MSKYLLKQVPEGLTDSSWAELAFSICKALSSILSTSKINNQLTSVY